MRSRQPHCVAVQVPDGFKRYAADIAGQLKKEGYEVIISGDPCYGACDLGLDTLGYADILVHFGHTPLQTHPRILYEPVAFDFDPAVVRKTTGFFSAKEIGLVTTAQHAHLLGEISRILASEGFNVSIGHGNSRTPLPGQVLGCSFEAARVSGAREILYIGTGVFHPLGVALATGRHVIALDPYTGESGPVDPSRLLRRRFALIEKARQAETYGIIVSMKSGQMRMTLAKHLASLTSKGFMVMLREVTPDALLNLGFGAYVNTACPRLAYDDQTRFVSPLLSPQEFEILCGVREWEEYTIDEIAPDAAASP